MGISYKDQRWGIHIHLILCYFTFSCFFTSTLLFSLSLWDFSGNDCVCKICVCIMSISCGLLFGTPSPAVVLHGRHVQTWVLFSLCPPDVYSFQEEGPVLDPHLAKHLAHFGIDMLHTNGVRTSFVSNSMLCLWWVRWGVSLIYLI